MISSTVNHIEKHLYAGEYCLAVFLDIQGAVADWYLHYLSNRRLDIIQGDGVYSTHLARVFPWGGVLSAKFWTVAFDAGVKIINNRGMFGQAYADDCCLMIGGTDFDFMYKCRNQVLMQLSK